MTTAAARSRRRVWVAAAVAIGILGLAALGGWVFLRAGAEADVPPPRFVDETAASGLSFTYDGPFVYAVGGGVAVFDCDGDGRQDVYLAGGAGPAGLFRNASAVGGALRFERVTDPATDLDAVNGAYAVDLDGDGWADLVLLRNGENVVLRGQPECRFTRANELWALDGGNELTEAFSATWEPGATWPTVAFGNYADPNSTDPNAICQPNVLVRPSAQGFGAPSELTPSFCTLSMLFSDWDGSGRRDLRVSNDVHYYRPTEGNEQLWRMAPGEAPRLYGAADGWGTVHIQGMGIASYDLTGDGLPEVYLTSQAASRLQTLAGDSSRPAYKDVGLAYGVNVAQPFAGADVHLPSTAWHPEFDDVNDDGLIDLFVSKGNVTTQPDYAMEDPSNLLLGQADGTFREAADEAGIMTFDRGRGAALADFNLDGRLDLVEAFYGAPVRIWRNTGPADTSRAQQAHWLAVRLRAPAPNVDAIGALVEVRAGDRTWRREVVVGGGHAGGQLGWIHVGLGAAAAAEVRVRWPGDGGFGRWSAVDVDAFSTVDRVSGVSRWAPPT